MKSLFIFLSAFLFPLAFSARGSEFYINQVKQAYGSYAVLSEKVSEDYTAVITVGEVSSVNVFGVYFIKSSNTKMLVCQIEEDLYELPSENDGSIWALACEYDEEVKVLVYDTQTKKSEIVASITDEIYESKDSFIVGDNGGCMMTKLSSMNDKYLTRTITYIVCGVVITVCIVLLLIFKVTHSGLFSKSRRTETVFNMKQFIENTPEEADPYDPLSEINLEEFREEKEDIEPEHIPTKSVKEYLMDKGFIVEYHSLSEDEKNKIMLELMILKNEGKISENDYKKETIELWKK